jgi:sulfur relay (sulfurtransferase) DsrF/TusC family protein
MSNVENVNILSDGEDIRTVTNCKFLVVLITNGSYNNEETKKRMSLSKPAMANVTKIIKTFKFQPSHCIKQSFQQCCMGAKENRYKKD